MPKPHTPKTGVGFFICHRQYNYLMKKYPLWSIGLLQALGLGLYTSLVATFMNNAVRWFGDIDKPIGGVVFLSLFVFSALTCALISLAYPIILIWDRKQTAKGFQLIGFTAAWLLLFIAILLTTLALR